MPPFVLRGDANVQVCGRGQKLGKLLTYLGDIFAIDSIYRMETE